MHKTTAKSYTPAVVQLTAAQLAAKQTAGTLPPAGVTIHIVDATTGAFIEAKTSAGASAQPTSGGGTGGSGSIPVNWAPGVTLDAGKIVLATVAVGGFIVGEQIYSTTAITTGTTFNTTEAARFISVPEDTTVAKKAAVNSITMLLRPEITISAGYPTLSVARTFSDSLIDFALANITASSFKTVTLGGANALNNTAALIANTINTSVANEMTCWVGTFADSITKALKLKFTATAGVVSVTVLQANHFATNVLTDAAWTTAGGNPTPSSTQAIASSDATASYGIKNLVLSFQNATPTASQIDEIALIKATSANIATPIQAYSASKTSYALNEQVIQSNRLYKCSTAITAAEAFTISKWTEVSAQPSAVPVVKRLRLRVSKPSESTYSSLAILQLVKLDGTEVASTDVTVSTGENNSGAAVLTASVGGLLSDAFNGFRSSSWDLGTDISVSSSAVYKEAILTLTTAVPLVSARLATFTGATRTFPLMSLEAQYVGSEGTAANGSDGVWHSVFAARKMNNANGDFTETFAGTNTDTLTIARTVLDGATNLNTLTKEGRYEGDGAAAAVNGGDSIFGWAVDVDRIEMSGTADRLIQRYMSVSSGTPAVVAEFIRSSSDNGTTWGSWTSLTISNIKASTFHISTVELAITEALHNNGEIHFEGTANATLNATAVTTDTFGFTVINTDAGVTRTLTPTGFAGVFLRDGSISADLGNVAFSIGVNEKYRFTVTVNGVNKYLNIENLNPIASDLPGSTPATINDEGLDSGNATIDRATVAGQTILKYETSGSSNFKVPNDVTAVHVLVAAGGGGGGSGVGGDLRGGGGGAGGLIIDTAFAVAPGALLTVTVGAGGAAATNGSNSVFATLTADGGGRGGSGLQTGFAGGSGGGGGANAGGANSSAGGTGTVSEGNDGGTGGSDGTTYRNGGGGGGANAVGAAGSANGTGGAGIASTITGTSVTYAGGGGGGGPVAANGGTGGGGRGGAYPAGAATAGSVNTGGGGGGGANTVTGAAGGSGVVIIRFATQSRTYNVLSNHTNNATALAAGLVSGEFYNSSGDESVKQVQPTSVTKVVNTEYISPNQHGNIYGIVYRQYFGATLPASLTSGNVVTGLIDHEIRTSNGSTRYVTRGWASDGSTFAQLLLSGASGGGNLSISVGGTFTAIGGWVDYTK